MSKEIEEFDADPPEPQQDMSTVIEREPPYSYEGYIAMGGRIDEENYRRVMKRASEESGHFRVGQLRDQTRITAEISGISLDAIRDDAGIDPRRIYEILRHDLKPGDAKHHHSQMSYQELLVESLRMLEQGDGVSAVLKKHSNISFN